MTVPGGEMDNGELYRRGLLTLAASWQEYARGAVDSVVRRPPGVVAAVFPRGPESTVYNNALLQRGMNARRRANALEAVEAAYASAGILHFAVWVDQGDAAMCDDLERRGYVVDTTALIMGLVLGEIRLSRPAADVEEVGWPEYLAAEELPEDFLARVDHRAFHPRAVRFDGRIVATALAYDWNGDCGIFNVGTREAFRRRGLASAVTLAQLYHARERGCVTASLQSTAMGESVYTAVGFRALGRILEYVPPVIR